MATPEEIKRIAKLIKEDIDGTSVPDQGLAPEGINLIHPDEVSGTSIWNDGTKVYWSEGRSSIAVFDLPDGRIIRIPSNGYPGITDEEMALLQKQSEFEALGLEQRAMTSAEESEWESHTAEESGGAGNDEKLVR